MQKYANLVECEKCRQTHILLQNFVLIQPRTSPPKICKNFPPKKLSNAYFLAKFGFDTAENEPVKNLQNFANFAKIANFADPNPLPLRANAARSPRSPRRSRSRRRRPRGSAPAGRLAPMLFRTPS